MTLTPASLLDRLRQPFEAAAWTRFVALYTPMIYSWGRRVGLQEQDAADLVQEVFVTLLQVLPSFSYDHQQSFRRWLRTVTLNKWRNLRKRRERKPVLLPGGDLDAMTGTSDGDSAWEAEYQQHLARQALTIMRADFQETTWRSCWETVVNGRAAGEVAAELGLTAGAVYAAKFRVLDRLRQELRGMLD